MYSEVFDRIWHDLFVPHEDALISYDNVKLLNNIIKYEIIYNFGVEQYKIYYPDLYGFKKYLLPKKRIFIDDRYYITSFINMCKKYANAELTDFVYRRNPSKIIQIKKDISREDYVCDVIGDMVKSRNATKLFDITELIPIYGIDMIINKFGNIKVELQKSIDDDNIRRNIVYLLDF